MTDLHETSIKCKIGFVEKQYTHTYIYKTLLGGFEIIIIK